MIVRETMQMIKTSLTWALLTSCCYAESKISLIALGDSPVRRYEMPDGSKIDATTPRKDPTPEEIEKNPELLHENHPILLPAKDGEAAPPALFLTLNGKPSPFRVGFNTPTTMKTVPHGKKLTLQRQEKNREFLDYLTLPALADRTQNLILLLPADDSETPWLKTPKQKIINIAEQATNSIVFRNYAKSAISIESQGKTLEVAPEATHTIVVDAEKPIESFTIYHASQKRPIYKQSIRPNKTRTHCVTFYHLEKSPAAPHKIGILKTSYTINK